MKKYLFLLICYCSSIGSLQIKVERETEVCQKHGYWASDSHDHKQIKQFYNIKQLCSLQVCEEELEADDRHKQNY